MRLKQLRKEFKYTQEQVADFLGVQKASYGRWENDVEQIPTIRLYELANLYSVNIDYLVGITGLKFRIKSSNNINLKEIGKHIRELRIELNMTLRGIGDKLSISNATWSTYEVGKVLINCNYLIEICKLTNISIDYVLCRSKVKYLSDYE